MGIGRPGGPYVDRLLDPDGWPMTDEDGLYNTATECTRKLQELTFGAVEPWAHETGEAFGGSVWTGGAASAANGKANDYVNKFAQQQENLVSAVTWYNHTAGMVAQAKNTVTSNVHEAQRLIHEIETSDDPDADAAERKAAIDNVINVYHALNVVAVASTAAQLPSIDKWKPPPASLERLLKQKLPTPPSATVPEPAPTPALNSPTLRNNVTGSPRGDAGVPTGNNGAPAAGPLAAPTAAPAAPPRTDAIPESGNSQGGPAPATAGQTSPPIAPPRGNAGGLSGNTSAPSTPNVPHAPSNPTLPAGSPPVSASPPAPSVGQGSPSLGSPGSPAAGGGSPSPLSSSSGTGAPGQSGPQTGQGGAGAQGAQGSQGASPTKPDPLSGATGPKTPGMQAPVQPPPAPLSSATPATPLSAPAAPIEQAAASSPTTPAAAHPAVPTGGGGPSASTAAPPSAPASPPPPMPLGPPSTPPPAAPVPPSAGTLGPGVAPAASSSAQSGGAAAAPIPVSAARAERDLMATSAAAGALKRQTGGNDPLSVARRIAAALNAPDMARPNDIGFFWLVALTAADTIVVANSYGIAYLPDGVNLPEQVKLASADSSIPAGERARWATYPVAALTGWAQAHDTTLRAVIGAKAHLEGIDPGAHKVLLEDDDIPATGKMTGRSRLEISFPDAAAKLAAVKDPDLVAQLPPAGADNTPPANDSFTLWFDVMQPLMSAASGREVAHLAAFVRYAAHAADLALYRAHTALEIADQRAAVADWLYWLHQYDLLTEAEAAVTATT